MSREAYMFFRVLALCLLILTAFTASWLSAS